VLTLFPGTTQIAVKDRCSPLFSFSEANLRCTADHQPSFGDRARGYAKRKKKRKEKGRREDIDCVPPQWEGCLYQMLPILSIPHIPHVLLLPPRIAQSFIERNILTYIPLSPFLIYLWLYSAVSISPHIIPHRNPISRIHMRELTDLAAQLMTKGATSIGTGGANSCILKCKKVRV
jgi:hypothetical protein